eukprot:4877111-Pyramimonas_sp.AAC.1
MYACGRTRIDTTWQRQCSFKSRGFCGLAGIRRTPQVRKFDGPEGGDVVNNSSSSDVPAGPWDVFGPLGSLEE